MILLLNQIISFLWPIDKIYRDWSYSIVQGDGLRRLFSIHFRTEVVGLIPALLQHFRPIKLGMDLQCTLEKYLTVLGP